MFYLIGGINAVGKSTILEGIVKERPDFEILHAGQELIKYMGAAGYEDLWKHTQEDNRAAFHQFIDEFMIANVGRDVLIDAHYMNLRHGRFSKVSDEWMRNMDGVVLITAPIKDVTTRVMADEDSGKRERGLFAMDATEAEKKVLLARFAAKEKSEFLHVATSYHLPHVVIHHVNDEVDDSVSKFLAFDQVVQGG